MRCGREPGGHGVEELGVCPASTAVASDGANRGRNGGRICWAIAGTLCGGAVQGTFAQKQRACMECEVFKSVLRDEGAAFTLLKRDQSYPLELLEHFEAITSIIDSMNAVVYVSDLDTCELLFMNPYAKSLFGHDRVGRRCYEVLQTGQTGPCPFCTNDRLVVDGVAGRPVVWEFRNTVTKRWFLCIDKAIPWWDGRLVRMEVAVDITERKLAEQFREQYVSLVSHDLRNPLQVITLRASALEMALENDGNPARAKMAAGLVAAANRMAAMLDDLLESARLEADQLKLEKARLDLTRLTRDVAARVDASSTRIQVDAPDAPVAVNADVGRIERVVENLFSNALRYSPAGAPVRATVRARGDEATLDVADSGVGIAADELPKLFQKFYRARTAAKVKGFGLGLYISRLLVEAHGGRVSVASVEGQGSTFSVVLPLAAAER